MALEKWLVSGEKVIDVGLVRHLKVAMVRGSVDIVGHDEPGARIEVHSVSGRELKISIDGDTLEIDHPQLRWDNFLDVFTAFRGSARADVSIMVPRDVDVKLGVVSASALVSGLTGDANLSTVNGDVVVDGHTGPVQLNSVSGELSIRGLAGTLTAHTVNGDLTAAGAIRRLSSDGVSGSVFIDASGAPDEMNINTVNGNVTVRVEPEVASHYRINTATGELVVDGSRITGVRGSYSGSFGALDGAWLDFKANTVSGNVSVIHAVHA
ncbi:DUF4097 family beta strand repeat-containing protein [Naasia lichenicola]|uniref:DUF4097 domain-containing protein n=1 Tax=Naasia lichenicola TaxID=2565933 RepID=A0A4V3WSV3_9MICO|nr:DUF4097 family beta strand repeat-containing protein [Naasia lichenicola]THG29557.1 hypothetical protein E6C64_12785 [Naasia lichenicola]